MPPFVLCLVAGQASGVLGGSLDTAGSESAAITRELRRVLTILTIIPPTGFDVPSSGASASSQVRGGIVLGVSSSERGVSARWTCSLRKNEYRLSHGSVDYSPSFAHPRPVKAPLRGACVDVSLDVVWYCPTRRSNRAI